jgi:phosphatidylglycerophosphate synthase
MDSLVDEERDEVVSLPNAISAGRALAGVALFRMLSKNSISPTAAFITTAAAAISDLEGMTIRLTRRYPRLQKALRIFPTKIGRKADPIADKILGIGVIAGGLIGGEIPLLPGTLILGTEVATAGISATAEIMGKDPQVSKGGKVGLILRFLSISSYLGANAFREHGNNEAHDFLHNVGNVSAAGAVVLGTYSAARLAYENFIQHEEAVQGIAQLEAPSN